MERHVVKCTATTHTLAHRLLLLRVCPCLRCDEHLREAEIMSNAPRGRSILIDSPRALARVLLGVGSCREKSSSPCVCLFSNFPSLVIGSSGRHVAECICLQKEAQSYPDRRSGLLKVFDPWWPPNRLTTCQLKTDQRFMAMTLPGWNSCTHHRPRLLYLFYWKVIAQWAVLPFKHWLLLIRFNGY